MQIPESRFYLKSTKSKETTLICMQVKYYGERIFISTGEKVIPSEWDFKRQRSIVTRKNLSSSSTKYMLKNN